MSDIEYIIAGLDGLKTPRQKYPLITKNKRRYNNKKKDYILVKHSLKNRDCFLPDLY